ncbi:MAG TPA: hypothetical protein VM050_11210 [Patescibacteria group bacterium]|nr:hypothetical protein [Patescibacteria group bacterium]
MKVSRRGMDLARQRLEGGDSIQRSYDGQLDGFGGMLAISRRKLLFVHEKGFLRKSYELILDLQYMNIGSITTEGRYRMVIEEVDGRKHRFETVGLPINVVDSSIAEFRSKIIA